MFKNLSIVIILFFSVFTINAQDNWIKYKATDAISFDVLVPYYMEYITKDIKTSLGPLISHTYVHQSVDDDPNYLYLINVIGYPKGVFFKDSIELLDEFLLSSIETAARSIEGEVVYSANLDEKHNGVGKVFRIKYNDGNAVMKGKVFINNDTFIMLQVFTQKSASLNDKMNYFLDSFRTRD
ncbi:MAG: hypothetical protein V3V14_05180 [Saprospiraceae bacterium]